VYNLGHTEGAMTSKHSSGCHMATEEDDHQRTQSGIEICGSRCGQQDTSTAWGRWRRQYM